MDSQQACSQDFLEGGLHVYACKTRGGGGGLGACSPRKCLEIRHPEIASEAILGHCQQSCRSMQYKLQCSRSIVSNF